MKRIETRLSKLEQTTPAKSATPVPEETEKERAFWAQNRPRIAELQRLSKSTDIGIKVAAAADLVALLCASPLGKSNRTESH